MRQHYERLTKRDEEIEQSVRALVENGASPRVEHLLFAYEP